ncbi:porin [Piscinibacter koreensis]|uniref:Porin n=1 Tax=Piscinibacter koreensis TaxID=2742824 RepID=A0A7Y6TV39_9BURK|nr:porin [Schlegelella koreensis]NUZ04536.1 porin [Schlegelella koreensis]
MIRSTRGAALALFALTAATAAEAQTAPSIYGLLDVSVARQRPAGGRTAYRLDSGNMTESFIGIRGSDDLGGGLRARYQLESFVRVDQGSAGRYPGDGFWSRDSFVGLQGAFGTTLLGRNTTPFFMATTSFNPFGESPGFSPSVRQYYGRALLDDRSWSNSLSYTNNATDKDLKVNLAYNAAEGSPGSTGSNVGASAFYIMGPVVLSGAVQRVRNSPLPLPPGFDRQDAWQIGATWELQVVRLYAQGGQVRTEADTDVRTRLLQVGASVPLGRGSVLAAFGHAKTRAAGARSTDRSASVAYDYNLSKSTDLYAAYLNERLTGLSTGHGLAAGMRIRF